MIMKRLQRPDILRQGCSAIDGAKQMLCHGIRVGAAGGEQHIFDGRTYRVGGIGKLFAQWRVTET
jgi:hypothetical protein